MKSRNCSIKTLEGVLVIVLLVCVQACAQRKLAKPAGVTTNSVQKPKMTQMLSTKELLKGSNPFKRICIIPFRNFSLNPRAAEETTDIVLTELYFSNIFDEIVENDEAKQEIQKLSSIKLLMNKKLVVSIGERLDIDGFLFGVVNQDNKDGKGDLVFDVSFSLIDAASGENVWSVNIRENQGGSGMATRFLFMKSVLKKVLADFRSQAPNIKRKVITVRKHRERPPANNQEPSPTYVENKAPKPDYSQNVPVLDLHSQIAQEPVTSFSRTYQGQPVNNVYAPIKTERQTQKRGTLQHRKPVEIPVQKNFSYGETPYLQQQRPRVRSNSRKTVNVRSATGGNNSSIRAPVFKYLRRKRVKSATISDDY